VVPPSQLKVTVAGRVALENGAAAIDEEHFPGRQGRLLFAYLVAEEGRPVPREELADALWGEAPPPTADKALAVVVSKLRGLLGDLGVDGARALTAAFGCYRLELPEGTWVDVVAAAEAVEDAERALAADDLGRAQAAGWHAASLLRLPFLPGEEAPWVEGKRREYGEIRLRALTVLGDAALRSGQPAQAARSAEQAVALAPFREDGYRRLMEAHVAAGNRAEALRVYEQCRRLLADELGAYPSPETEAVYRDLLAAPAPAPAEPPRTPAAPPPGGPARKPRRAQRPRRRTLLLAAAALAAVAGLAAGALAKGGGGVRVRPDSLVEIDQASGRIERVVQVGRSPGEVAAVGPWVFVTSLLDGTVYRISRASGEITSSGRYSVGRSLARQDGSHVWLASPTQAVVRLVRAGSLESVGFDRVPLLTGGEALPGTTLPSVAVGGGSLWVAEMGVDKVFQWRLRAFARPVLVRRYPLRLSDWTLGAAYGGGAAWVALGDPADAVLRIDAFLGEATRIPVGRWPSKPAVGFGSVWVPMFRDDDVWRLDPATGQARAIVKVGHRPWSVAIGKRGVWVSDHCDGTVELIDPSTNRVVRRVRTGFHAQWLAAAGDAVWVGIAENGLQGSLGSHVMGCQPLPRE
jgi:SARP family transcriptional regulator, regulator of embCAB operon